MVAHSFNPLRGNRSVSLLSSDFNSEKKNEFKIEKSMNRAICPFFPFSFFSFPFTLPSLVKIYLFIFQSVQIQISSTCPLSQRKVCSLRFVEFSKISILISISSKKDIKKKTIETSVRVYVYIKQDIRSHLLRNGTLFFRSIEWRTRVFPHTKKFTREKFTLVSSNTYFPLLDIRKNDVARMKIRSYRIGI